MVKCEGFFRAIGGREERGSGGGGGGRGVVGGATAGGRGGASGAKGGNDVVFITDGLVAFAQFSLEFLNGFGECLELGEEIIQLVRVVRGGGRGRGRGRLGVVVFGEGGGRFGWGRR
jgi:hypothetical protein